MVRNYHEAIGGGILVAVGLIVFLVAITSLNMGTPGRMGPGFFPAACGVLLAAIGIGITLAGFLGKGEAKTEETEGAASPKALLIVLLALGAFAALIRPTGMTPAVFGLVLVASLAEPRITWLQTIVAGAILSAFASLAFVVGLKLPVPLISLPW